MRRSIAFGISFVMLSTLAACGGGVHVNPQTPIVIPPSPGPAVVMPAATPAPVPVRAG